MSKSSSKWALGTLAAAATGFLAGILTAPKSGKETRQDAVKKAHEISGEAEEKLKLLYRELGEQADSLKSTVKKVKGKAGDKVDDLHKEVEGARERARKAISALRAGDEDEIDKVIADLERLKKVVAKRFSTAKEELKK